MEITTGLIAKVGGGAVLVGGGATGIYFGHDYLSNSISRYDTALMDFLDTDEAKNDIIFEVKKGENGNEDLGTNDITLSGTNTPSPVKVKIKANTTDLNATFKTNGNTPDETALKGIKQLNKNDTGWIWECSFNFAAEGQDISGKTIKDEYKNRIFQNSGLGLFGLLKKDLSNYNNPTTEDATKWTKKEIIQVKSNFIKKCGQSRGISQNRKLNKEKVGSEEIKVKDIVIKFKAEGDKLVPADETTFNYWFIDSNKTYNS